MSFDYVVTVRGRKRSAASIRELVASVAPLAERDDDQEDNEDGDELDYYLPNLGSIQLRRLRRGYQLTIDSTRDGNRDHFAALGAIVDGLASKLGVVVKVEQLVLQMEDETDAAKPEPPALASTAVVSTLNRDGQVIESASVYLDHFVELLDAGGMPSSRVHFARPPLMDEDRRFELRASRMTATLYDSDGCAFRRYDWRLDGYGRITGVDISKL